MSLDDLKDELEFELTMRARGLESDSQVVRDAVEVGWLQLDAGATYAEAMRAALAALESKEAA